MNKLPIKPIDATWTDEQWRAIYSKDQDILVAAAAGSGKTAVLVERMIKKVVNEEQPININELLVVTFTKASAAEMKHRIGSALEEEISKNPTSVHLKQQLSLLNQASISTLHSFCQEVIRQNYYKINLDPNFRLADETEIRLIKDEIVESIFERIYERANGVEEQLQTAKGKEKEKLEAEHELLKTYFKNIDFYTNDRNDIAIKALILQLYEFIMANPNPVEFLDQLIAPYNLEKVTSIRELPYFFYVENYIHLSLNTAKKYLEQAIQVLELDPGLEARLETINSDLSYLMSIERNLQHSWDDAVRAVAAGSFVRAKAISKKVEHDEELKKQAEALRDHAKNIVKVLKEEFFEKSEEVYIEELYQLKDKVVWLVETTKQFHQEFRQEKERRGILDFSDLEHYCLEILGEEDKNTLTDVAYAYKQRFKEVLVDEYQDTNFVQEAILQAVSKGPASKGNRFMVGDVKQSIYRFRLAEPKLFLGKYQNFTNDGENSGLKIDLAKNFRSREEVLHGTNFIFKQIMNENIGEIDYDDAAELKVGAYYPTAEELKELTNNHNYDANYAVELTILEEKDDLDESMDSEVLEELKEMNSVTLQARYIAQTINKHIKDGLLVWDGKKKQARQVEYRDFVILLRSMKAAPQIMEELKQANIPAYANLSDGYFESIEVKIILDVLSIVDNPYQDIPLAGVLRSPIVGLTENELAEIRKNKKHIPLIECVRSYNEEETNEFPLLIEKITQFKCLMNEFRNSLKDLSLSELIWDVYRKTNYYEYVGGLPGGKQRQANLRALYDRSLQYETTSFRGLFNFLQFIKTMRERGDDLGTARALGEQENVVRLMTIHSSKGLEFPVVFVAHLNKNFNEKDLKQMSLLDKDFGLAVKMVDLERRITTPTIFYHAMKQKKYQEMQAEEMRVLYVALTRAKEKLYLVGSVDDLEKKASQWQVHQNNSEWLLDDYERLKTKNYMDWVVPSVLRHEDAKPYRYLIGNDISADLQIQRHPSHWKINCLTRENLVEEKIEQEEKKIDLEFIPSPYYDELSKRLSWHYPYEELTKTRAKQSVSEIKKNQLQASSTDNERKIYKRPISKRPLFMQQEKLTSAEKGTAMHKVMQYIPYDPAMDIEKIESFIKEMVKKELLTTEEEAVVSSTQIMEFFRSPLGQRMLHAKNLQREVPFSLGVPASEVYHKDDMQGSILVQGIMDCLFEEDGKYILVDFKTDNLQPNPETKLKYATENHRLQLDFYKKAIETIYQAEVKETYIYFFDGGIVQQLL